MIHLPTTEQQAIIDFARTRTEEIKNAFRYDDETGILYWRDYKRQKKANAQETFNV